MLFVLFLQSSGIFPFYYLFFLNPIYFLVHDSLAISFFFLIFFFPPFSLWIQFVGQAGHGLVLLLAPNLQKEQGPGQREKKQREEKDQRQFLADDPITKFTASNPKEMTPFSICYAHTTEYRVQY